MSMLRAFHEPTRNCWEAVCFCRYLLIGNGEVIDAGLTTRVEPGRERQYLVGELAVEVIGKDAALRLLEAY